MDTNTLTITTPSAAQLKNEGDCAVATAEFISINNDSDLEFATNEMNAMSKRLKEIEAARKAITGPLDQAKKSVMALFKPATEGYQNAISSIKSSIATYVDHRDRLIAQQNAESEKIAEQERQAILSQVSQCETEEEKDILLETAAMIVPETKLSKTVSGMSTYKRWKGEVIDLPTFLSYLARHPELQHCIQIKQAELDRFISATDGKLSIPGVKVHQVTVVSGRTK